MRIPLPKSVTRTATKLAFKATKHSPSLLLVGGIAAGVTGTVLACKATLKVEEVLDEAKANMDKVKEASSYHLENYNEEDQAKDVAIIAAKTGVQLLKLYGPALVCGIISVVCLTKSHQILLRRNGALMASYVALDTAYKNYRQRVVDQYGGEAARELGIERETTEVLERTDKGSKTKEITSYASGNSPYQANFDRSSSNWQTDPNANAHFLLCQQTWMNRKLQMNGHVFLNEVLDALGIERVPNGQLVGWQYKGDGDGYIEFAIVDEYADDPDGAYYGVTNAYLLDFNVDGMIYDKI